LIDKTGKEIIAPQFDDMGVFSEGLLAVLKKGKWGYIDSTQKTIIKFEFAFAGNFSEGLARVKRTDKFGYIDNKGLTQTPSVFDQAGDFSGGIAKVSEAGKIGFINKNNAYVLRCEIDEASTVMEGDVVLLKKNHKMAYFNLKTANYIWREAGFEAE